MPISIQMPQQQKDAVERLSGALGLVAGVKKVFFDGPTAEEAELSAIQRRKASADAQSSEDSAAGVLGEDKLLAHSSNYEILDKAEPGSQEFKRRKDGTVVPVFLKPRATLGLEELIKRQNYEKGGVELAKQKKEAAQGKPIPANDAIAIGGSESSLAALNDAAELFKNNSSIAGPMQGYVSALKGKIEYGDEGKQAKVFDAQLKMNAQMIGKYLEGGKLTDTDIDRYKAMLPNLNDSEDTAKAKIQVVQRLISQKQESEAAALSGAGYDVSGIGRSAVKPGPDMLDKKQTKDYSKLSMEQFNSLPPKEMEEAIRQQELREKGIAGGIPKGKKNGG